MIKTIQFGILCSLILIGINANAQTENSKSEIDQISETLMDYIEGTGKGEPERIRKAFHPDFNLYTVTAEDRLLIRSGEKYISNVKEGVKKQQDWANNFN
ncbi:nuclear transport factor 2 family protein [Flavobacteriaceae bacterium]|jgi:hypothetical protein|nr:nuclear transport factor 2 family protein [Flavobacteriaceae bacterium]MDC3330343.1 nuclear transport factor 2 family protein [Flavobacteriaceae bacterium]